MSLDIGIVAQNLQQADAVLNAGGPGYAHDKAFHSLAFAASGRSPGGVGNQEAGDGLGTSIGINPIDSPGNRPLGSWRSVFWAVLLLLLALGVLAYFISPAQWVAAVRAVPPQDMLGATVFFLAGCLALIQRWRACLAYRLGFLESSHSLGIAMAGNLLIPGRSGEPLRVYALAAKGFPADISTSGIVQERLADQIFRIAFLILALLLGGVGGKARADYQLLGILLATVGLIASLGLMIRYRIALARVTGRWMGRLPKLTPELVESFVRNTLTDLAGMRTRPGGMQSLVWGALAWGLMAVHVNFVIEAFFGPGSFTLTCVAMAFATPTTAGKPGYYHFLLVASLMVFKAARGPSLQVAVVLHLFQGLFFTLWGIAGWFLLKGGQRISVPVVVAESPRL